MTLLTARHRANQATARDAVRNLVLAFDRGGVCLYRVGIAHGYRALATAVGLGDLWGLPTGIVAADIVPSLATGIERVRALPFAAGHRLTSYSRDFFGWPEGFADLVDLAIAACREFPDATLRRLLPADAAPRAHA